MPRPRGLEDAGGPRWIDHDEDGPPAAKFEREMSRDRRCDTAENGDLWMVAVKRDVTDRIRSKRDQGE